MVAATTTTTSDKSFGAAPASSLVSYPSNAPAGAPAGAAQPVSLATRVAAASAPAIASSPPSSGVAATPVAANTNSLASTPAAPASPVGAPATVNPPPVAPSPAVPPTPTAPPAPPHAPGTLAAYRDELSSPSFAVPKGHENDNVGFLASRGAGLRTDSLNPIFVDRAYAILGAGETATNQRSIINELGRTNQSQAQFYANKIGQPITYMGVTYKPDPSRFGVPAAKPLGYQGAPGSAHLWGRGMDLSKNSPVTPYVRAHVSAYGLQLVPGDYPHIQADRSIITPTELPKALSILGYADVKAFQASRNGTLAVTGVVDPRTAAAMWGEMDRKLVNPATAWAKGPTPPLNIPVAEAEVPLPHERPAYAPEATVTPAGGAAAVEAGLPPAMGSVGVDFNEASPTSLTGAVTADQVRTAAGAPGTVPATGPEVPLPHLRPDNGFGAPAQPVYNALGGANQGDPNKWSAIQAAFTAAHAHQALPATKDEGIHVLNTGDKSHLVGMYQTMLSGMGYYQGKLDNKFGALTDTAVRQFQMDWNADHPDIPGQPSHQIRVDGKIGMGPLSETGPAISAAFQDKIIRPATGATFAVNSADQDVTLSDGGTILPSTTVAAGSTDLPARIATATTEGAPVSTAPTARFGEAPNFQPGAQAAIPGTTISGHGPPPPFEGAPSYAAWKAGLSPEDKTALEANAAKYGLSDPEQAYQALYAELKPSDVSAASPFDSPADFAQTIGRGLDTAASAVGSAASRVFGEGGPIMTASDKLRSFLGINATAAPGPQSNLQMRPNGDGSWSITMAGGAGTTRLAGGEAGDQLAARPQMFWQAPLPYGSGPDAKPRWMTLDDAVSAAQLEFPGMTREEYVRQYNEGQWNDRTRGQTNVPMSSNQRPDSRNLMRVANDTDYARLPKGTTFIDPEGHRRVKV